MPLERSRFLIAVRHIGLADEINRMGTVFGPNTLYHPAIGADGSRILSVHGDYIEAEIMATENYVGAGQTHHLVVEPIDSNNQVAIGICSYMQRAMISWRLMRGPGQPGNDKPAVIRRVFSGSPSVSASQGANLIRATMASAFPDRDIFNAAATAFTNRLQLDCVRATTVYKD